MVNRSRNSERKGKITFFLSIPLSLSVICLLGFISGLGGVTFVEGQGLSYFSNDPKACMNCHIMRDQYESWSNSGHREFTTCNTCHAPENPAWALLYKAENGLNHSFKFTTGYFTDPIQIRPHNKRVALDACLNCHSELFRDSPHKGGAKSEDSCLQCHHNVGHPMSSRR